MESLLTLVEARISFNSILQIGIDVIILGLLVAIMRVKRPGTSKKAEAIVASFEKIVEETAEISRKFETNLEKRQELLQQLTAGLDERIQEGNKLCARLEKLSRLEVEKPAAMRSSVSAANEHLSVQQKVLSLSDKGLNGAEIAKRLKRPVGEIELILNLRKIGGGG
ncbi:MAG: DUF6115 domain-containing protein [Syntrophobacteraceae bacterium]